MMQIIIYNEKIDDFFTALQNEYGESIKISERKRFGGVGDVIISLIPTTVVTVVAGTLVALTTQIIKTVFENHTNKSKNNSETASISPLEISVKNGNVTVINRIEVSSLTIINNCESALIDTLQGEGSDGKQ